MMTDGVQVGQIVRSAAGRDKGKIYLVYDVLDEAFVRVIDGDKKKFSNPKRKNVKHLEFLPHKADNIADKIRGGRTIREEEIMETIKSLGLSHKD